MRTLPLGLLLLGLPLGAVHRAPAGPTDIRGVDDLIDAPRILFGRTRAEIERRLGEPRSVRTVTLRRPDRPPQPGQELSYPGLVIQVTGSGRLQQVALGAPGHRLPHGLDIGAARDHVERVLGETQAVSDTHAMYLYSDGYPDTVELYFDAGRVSRIEWRYWTS